MTSPSNFSVVIPAAGIGARMASDIPKQYLTIAGKTVLEHAINTFIDHPLIQHIVICLHPNDTIFKQLGIANHHKIHSVNGGETRAESVLKGLHFLRAFTDSWVLVHDAARPGLSQRTLNKLMAARAQCTGAILALPVVDTIKSARADSKQTKHFIKKTIDRSSLWHAQTPQMFNIDRLIFALNNALKEGLVITDEASAIEHLGDEITIIEGESGNLKITRPEDLTLAAFYLQADMTQREPT